MADVTKDTRRIHHEKAKVRDEEVGREHQHAGISKKGYGGMDTKNKGTEDKKGI